MCNNYNFFSTINNANNTNDNNNNNNNNNNNKGNNKNNNNNKDNNNNKLGRNFYLQFFFSQCFHKFLKHCGNFTRKTTIEVSYHIKGSCTSIYVGNK